MSEVKDPRETRGISRRGFLHTLGAAAMAAGLSSLPLPVTAEERAAKSTGPRSFRFVFLPDIHLREDLRSPQGMAACLEAVEKLRPRPAFLVTGGDQCHDLRSLGVKEANARANLFLRIWNDHTDLPAYHCLGNHDAAGWGKGNIPKDHPDFGFNLLRRKLGMKDLYYSFDHGPWHFVVLHNVMLTEPGQHIGEFPKEQLDFLRADLGKNKAKPTMVFSHLPAVTALEFFDGRAQKTEEGWTLDFSRVANNPQALAEAMRVGNVKAALSGHIHRAEQMDVEGKTFICAGSVSGAQWRGHQGGTPAGFGIVDCQADGSFAYRYHDYGWKAA